MHAITAAEHFNAVQRRTATRSARAGSFAKPGETQEKAIKRLMASHKRAWNKDPRTVDNFPRWSEAMTTADYVGQFERLNHLIPGACDVSHGGPLDRRAPFYVGPEVEALRDVEATDDTYAFGCI